MMRDHIYVYIKEPAVRVLGPGVRYGLWVQGCLQHCPGCIAENSHEMKAGKPISIDALVFEIAHSKAEGITISGGEPFLQAEELAQLLARVKQKRKMGVIIYTGYKYEDLLKDEKARTLLEETDLLIDGPYIKELDDGKSLRGSSNQRVIPLTDMYREDLSAYGIEGRERETFNHGILVHIVGIPQHNRAEEDKNE
ncbi:MAG: radical SAM protein [Lachnospiraceae bacterium]|nr:radical SAM protein [Lachnospiraceae bacterium]